METITTTPIPQLSLVLPTFNEVESLPHVARGLQAALAGIPHEVIVVDDDSPDGTASVGEGLAAEYPQLVVIRRRGKRGLFHAVLEGFARSRGSALGVMDADLQHDERVLPLMLEALRTHNVVVASRYMGGGSTVGWSVARALQSRLGAALSRRALGLAVRDPLSGFFLMRREVFQDIASSLRPRGWKVLLEILAHIDARGVTEVPYTFGPRERGTTKMKAGVVVAWMKQLVQLRRERRARLVAGRILPRPRLALAGNGS